ncbi:hypothetical protein ALT_0485 [Aspergillus lentulus]|uniref:Uncharacterized protein n=1 Tax=Aspergillus lentulus TaxID=293939 RepID=A0AAN4T6Z0_ASPLE|nr:hypothetical protein ALT_0485 [Aspergillus lentulus]GFF56593.1 hypothetical protein IFM62136_03161 [Aspergillus lentulus]GFG10860.1 hypothetical protein IFM61392_06615 [Aspergillus lentulus]
MAPSFLRKLSLRRRRDDNNIVESSPHSEVPKMRGAIQALPLLSTQNNNPENNRHADAYKAEKYDALCRLHAQPANASKSDPDQSPQDTQALIEPGVDPSDQEPAFTWQDVEPRTDFNPPSILEYFNYELSPTEKDNLLYMETQRQSSARSAGTIPQLSTVPEARELRSALERAVQARMLGISTTLPPYNEVSGAVIVNQEGLPHFLSPQEEEERQVSLRRAVEERMLGLPRRTSFTWAQSHGPSLPSYSPARYK